MLVLLILRGVLTPTSPVITQTLICPLSPGTFLFKVYRSYVYVSSSFCAPVSTVSCLKINFIKSVWLWCCFSPWVILETPVDRPLILEIFCGIKYYLFSCWILQGVQGLPGQLMVTRGTIQNGDIPISSIEYLITSIWTEYPNVIFY